MTTALYATQLISTSLYARTNEKFGRKIEISLMEAAAAMQSIRLMSGYMEGLILMLHPHREHLKPKMVGYKL